jgi:hypothetical protein
MPQGDTKVTLVHPFPQFKHKILVPIRMQYATIIVVVVYKRHEYHHYYPLVTTLTNKFLSISLAIFIYFLDLS